MVACLRLFAAASEPSPGLQLARQLNEAFAEVAERVSPAVVIIDVIQLAGTNSGPEEDEERFEAVPPELWRYYRERFGQRAPDPARGEGSGVIIRDDGYILTNGHVVDSAESIRVRLKDGRVFKASVRGVDPQSDVAVIKIDAKGLPVATLADSSKTMVGEFAIAIGAPFDLDYTVTIGHISAKGRSNVIRGREAQRLDQDYLQTDALINPGNSGGPLLNIDGEVIGINTMIRGLHTGIGFAIPSSLAREVSDKLIADGKFTRPWLGITIRALRDNPAARAAIKGVDNGVVVEEIMPEGPAARSDLARSDIITAVDGRAVSNAEELRGEVRRKTIGKPVTLEVYRLDAKGNCKPLQIQVTLSEWVQPPTVATIGFRNPATERDPSGLGVTVHILTLDVARLFGAEVARGVLVVGVEKGTPAARKGIQPGDIITAVDKKPIASPKEFREAIKSADVKKGVALDLMTGMKAHVEILKAPAE
jgi:serine protease Do